MRRARESGACRVLPIGAVTVGQEGVDLEVVSVDPLKLELAPMEEEDWGE